MGRKSVESTRRAEYERLVAMLREAREKADLSQGELARRLGFPQPRLSAIESGARRIDPVELVDILRVLGIEPAEFVRRWTSVSGD